MDMNSVLSEVKSQFERLNDLNMSTEATLCFKPLLKYREEVLFRKQQHITFFGLFKTGKSTLLNALIGTPLLPMRANRATTVVTEIGYAPSGSAGVQRNSQLKSREEIIAIDDVARYILPVVSTSESRTLENVERVLIHLPIALTQDQNKLIDTPGLLDDPTLTERTVQELACADVAVMVLSADKLLSMREKQAISKLNDLLSGNILFIINRMNLVDKEERAEIISWAYHALVGVGNRLVGKPRIFVVDALGALESRIKGDFNSTAVKNLVLFEEYLMSLLDKKQGIEVACLARLGVLENHLLTAHHHIEAVLAQTKSRHAELEAQQQRIATQRQNERDADRQRIAMLQSNMQKWVKKFEEDFIANAKRLIETDTAWQSNLQDTVSQAISDFESNVRHQVNVAIETPDIAIGPFTSANNNSQTVAIADNSRAWIVSILGVLAIVWLDGGFTEAVIAGAIARLVFGIDIKQETLKNVKHLTIQLRPVLQQEAEQYLTQVEDQLSKSELQGLTPSPALINMQAELHYYSQLYDWCKGMHQAINRSRMRITK